MSVLEIFGIVAATIGTLVLWVWLEEINDAADARKWSKIAQEHASHE